MIADQQHLSLLQEFQRNAEARRRLKEELDTEPLLEERHDHEQRDLKDRERMNDALANLKASEAQIAEFHQRLNHYDTAVVEALMDNRKALDDVNGRIDVMRAHAFGLPDGRRVFKTEDGERVFDESGRRLARDEFDPDLIGDSMPKWEVFKPQLDARKHLEREQMKLTEFQAKVDKAREDFSRESFGKTDLEQIEAELQNDIPDVIKQKFIGNAQSGAIPKLLTDTHTRPAALSRTNLLDIPSSLR